jgi:hypothetical protein
MLRSSDRLRRRGVGGPPAVVAAGAFGLTVFSSSDDDSSHSFRDFIEGNAFMCLWFLPIKKINGTDDWGFVSSSRYRPP